MSRRNLSYEEERRIYELLLRDMAVYKIAALVGVDRKTVTSRKWRMLISVKKEDLQ